MLLTKEVEVRWATKTKSTWQKRGYKFTRLGDAFMVKVKDLPMQSSVKVLVACDKCGERYYKTYARVSSGEDICRACYRQYVSVRIKVLEQRRNKKGRL